MDRTATTQCDGILVVHADGTPAACTEELGGHCCPGPDAPHAGGTTQCTTLLGVDGCETCAVESFSSRDWRHATHVARLSRGDRRCHAHRVALVTTMTAQRAHASTMWRVRAN